MAEFLKTVENDHNVEAYIRSVENLRRRADAWTMLEIMESETGEEPKMWGSSIIGFGKYRYKRSDRSEHEWMLTGFAPRKAATVVYVMPGFSAYGELMSRLGRYRHSVSCLYISRLTNVDLKVLREVIRRSAGDMRSKYLSGL